MLKTDHIECISSRNIEFRLLTRGTWIKRCLHVKIMTERRIVLGLQLSSAKGQRYDEYKNAFKHNQITQKGIVYCTTKPFFSKEERL